MSYCRSFNTCGITSVIESGDERQGQLQPDANSTNSNNSKTVALGTDSSNIGNYGINNNKVVYNISYN